MTRKPMAESKVEFARHLADGKTQILSYKLSHPNSKASDKTIGVEACRLNKDPEVMALVADLVRNKTVEQIDSQGQHMLRTLEGREQAQKDGNRTAQAAYDRLLAQMHGMTSERVRLTVEGRMSDEELASVIAGGTPGTEGHNQELYKLVIDRMGKDGF